MVKSERSLDVYSIAEPAGDTPVMALRQFMELWQIGEVGLLKMDIEGAEAEVFASLDRETLMRIRRLAVEYHSRAKPGMLDSLLQRLGDSHDVVVEAQGQDCGMLYAVRRDHPPMLR